MDSKRYEDAGPSPQLDDLSRRIRDRALTQLMSELDQAQDEEAKERLRLRLIYEADRFGTHRERLDKADALIDVMRTRIRNQQRLVERLWEGGRDTRMADRLLETYEKTYVLFCEYREVLQVRTDWDEL